MLSEVPIIDVWSRLGGKPLQGGRGAAFWRDSRDYNVAVDASKNVYYDHARNEGGGILHLVQAVLSAEKTEALLWLEHEAFIEPRKKFTPAEKAAWREQRQKAEETAFVVNGYRADELYRLRGKRNQLYSSETRSCRIAQRLLSGNFLETQGRWDTVWAHALDDQRGVEVDTQVDRLESATQTEVLAMM